MRKLLFIFALLLAPAWTMAAEGDIVLAVIVPKSQNLKVAGVADLALIFWRKKLYWAEGVRMQPVNLPTANALRRQFSLKVLNTLPEDQTEYWNEMYYHGVMPPHVVSSQEAVLRYVADTPGAIGYIDACKVDVRVKAIYWMTTDSVFTSVPASLNCPE